MTFDKYAENLEKAMQKQLKLVNRFYRVEEQIKKCLAEKNWPELEKELAAIQQLSGKIEAAEQDRYNIYQAMKLYCSEDNIESFYVFISKYCPERKEKLTELYRELKSAVIRIKTLTLRIEAYINTVTTAVKHVLDEVFPMRRGTIYDSSGTNRAVLQPPVVFDREL